MTEVQQWVKDLSSDAKHQLQWLFENARKHGIDLTAESLDSSISSVPWLDDVYNNIMSAKMPTYTTETSSANKTDVDEILKLFKKSSFIDDAFAKIVADSADTLLKHTYTCTDSSIIITVITSPEWPEVTKQIIDSIMACCRMLPKIFPWASPPKVTRILLIPTPLLKLYSEDCKWDPIHINSGYSERKIVIWRRQEILKVAIHELMHLYSIELSKEYFNNPQKFGQIENSGTPTTNTNDEPRWNEGATEALATVVHLAAFCRLYDLDKQHYYLFLHFERAHARLMSSTIYTTCTSVKSQESTSVFSYFVVKSLLMDNLPAFGELLVKRQYEPFQEYVSERIANWKPLTGVHRAPFLRMSAVGL